MEGVKKTQPILTHAWCPVYGGDTLYSTPPATWDRNVYSTANMQFTPPDGHTSFCDFEQDTEQPIHVRSLSILRIQLGCLKQKTTRNTHMKCVKKNFSNIDECLLPCALGEDELYSTLLLFLWFERSRSMLRCVRSSSWLRIPLGCLKRKPQEIRTWSVWRKLLQYWQMLASLRAGRRRTLLYSTPPFAV